MKPSEKFSLNRTDLIAWFKNAVWFLIPTLLVFLPDVANALPKWFPKHPGEVALIIWGLNRVVDILRRWYRGV